MSRKVTKQHKVELGADGAGPFRQEPGWYGAFTREQASGAIYANGTRVRKAKSEAGDLTPIGMLGTVLGSIQVPGEPFFYFIEWDDRKHAAIGCIDWKLEAAEH